MTVGPDQSREDWSFAVLRWLQTSGPLIIVALAGLPLLTDGGQLWPWRPATPELGALRQLGESLITGTASIAPERLAAHGLTPAGLALSSVLALATTAWWQILLTAASVSALQSILRRLTGLTGWALLAVGTLVFLLVEPVRVTIAEGHPALLVLWLVVSDLIGTRHQRVLAPGVRTGIAAAISLAPIWVILLLLFSGRRRTAAVATFSAASCSSLVWLMMPGHSDRYVDELLRGHTLGPQHLVADNHSMGATLARLGVNHPGVQILTMLVTLAAVWVASQWWSRRPELALGITLVASSWPLAMALPWTRVGVVLLLVGLARGWFEHRDGWALLPVTAWAMWVGLGVSAALLGPGPVHTTGGAMLAGLDVVLGMVAVVATATLKTSDQDASAPSERVRDSVGSPSPRHGV